MKHFTTSLVNFAAIKFLEIIFPARQILDAMEKGRCKVPHKSRLKDREIE